MKKLLPIVVLFVISFTLLFLTPRAYALTQADCDAKAHDVPYKQSDGTTITHHIDYSLSDFGCIPNDPVAFAQQYYGYGLGMIGGVSILFIMYGGYIFMTSQGNPIMVNKGKSYIFYAIAGLLLAVFGYVFIQVIVVDILHVPGFNG